MSLSQLIVIVEGRNDAFVINHLLSRHSIPSSVQGAPSHTRERIHIKFSTEDGKSNDDAAISEFGLRLKVGDHHLAIVLDSDVDTPIEARLDSLRNILASVEVLLPRNLADVGFMAQTSLEQRVGIWIMPNNVDTGGLERFLEMMVNKPDLYAHASEATQKAIEIGAELEGSNIPKANIHTYLAWQKVPGCPYGLAVKVGAFDHRCDLAYKFVEWIRSLVPESPASA